MRGWELIKPNLPKQQASIIKPIMHLRSNCSAGRKWRCRYCSGLGINWSGLNRTGKDCVEVRSDIPAIKALVGSVKVESLTNNWRLDNDPRCSARLADYTNLHGS